MPPLKLVRSPEYDGSWFERLETGDWFVTFALNATLYAAPEIDEIGAQSSAPKTRSWSFVRSVGMPLTTAGMDAPERIESNRVTESRAIPEVWRPSALVLSRVCRSFARRPAWTEML